MSNYNPLLKNVWHNELATNELRQNGLKNKSFMGEKSLLAWREIEKYKRDDAFYMEILDQYKNNYLPFLQALAGEELEFSRLVATFWESLCEHKLFKQQLEKKKATVIKNIIYYKYNNNTFKEAEPLVGKIVAYLQNPSYEMPIFSNSAEQKLDNHFLPVQMDILGDSFGKKCKQLAAEIPIKGNNSANNLYLLAMLFFTDSVKKIWASAEEQIWEQAETAAEAIVPYQVSRQRSEYPLNQILYGVAGTGKTYQARQIAAEITSQNGENVEFITFHAGYYYEDFIEGIKPKVGKNGLIYEVQDGVFKQICARAAADPNHNYVLIIDEINRANLSQVFGELISLIEPNKRGGNAEALSAKLPYSKQNFEVPSNLYLIGTMNSSDKSITAIDWALRRRFYFKEVLPQSGLLADKNIEGVELARLLETINERAAIQVGSEAQIGHSYFLQIETFAQLNEVIWQQIIPLLTELLLGEVENIQHILSPAFVEELNYPQWGRSRWRVKKISPIFPQAADYQQIYEND